MTENRISATLSPEDRKAVMEAIQSIRTKLLFLIGLDKEERASLPRMGNKFRAFGAKAL